MLDRMPLLRIFPLLLCLLGPCLAEDGGLYFSVSPAKHSVVEGSPVTLRCEAQPSGRVKYTWKIDGQPLAPNPRRHQVAGDLHITRVSRMHDGGSFVCVATLEDTGYSIESSPAKIDFQWISEASVQLLLPKLPSLIQVGGKVELRCHVEGSGELRYEWFRNTASVGKSDRIEITKNKLHILRATAEDSGIYTCLARNEAGSSSVTEGYPLVVSSNDTATIKVVPRSLIVKRAEPAVFHCVFEDADVVQWFFKEIIGPLETDEEKTVFENGTLVIRAAEHRDQGFYSCQGLRGDSKQVYTVELQIAYLRNFSVASFEPALPNQIAIVGEEQELQISCLEPSGLPAPKVYWRDPKGHIISDSGLVRVQDNTLIIAKARVTDDEGNYTCVAENLAGETDMPVQVIVSTPPTLIGSPESLTVLEGEPVNLTCSYGGMEPPVTHVRWLKDGEPVKETGGPTRHRLTDHHGNVTLYFKSDLNDEGTYVCEITTKGFPPIFSEPANLTVEERLKFSPPPVNKRLELGSTVRVYCKAQGETSPTVRWIKEGSSEEFPKHVQDINGTLHFNGVVEEDKGRYTCIASNAQGSINHTISIVVGVAPIFTIQLQNLTEAIEGYPLMLHCAAKGNPKPTIQWDRDSSMNNLNDLRFEVLTNGSLFIKEVYLGDEGKYGCTAGNSGGFKRQEVQLIVKAGDSYRSDMDLDAGDDGAKMTKTVTIALGVAAGYMVLVVGLMLYCRYRRRRRKQRYLQEQTEEKLENGEVQEEQTELKDTANKTVANSTNKNKENRDSHKSDGADTAQSQSSNQSKKSKSNYDKIAVSRSNLKDLKPLGRGEFGEIYGTKYQVDGDKETLVMVKSLTNTKDEAVLQEFKRHLDLLHKLNHENVVKLIGLCRDEEPNYMILEYTDWGDLKQFLVASRKESTGNSSPSHESKASRAKAPQLSVAQILSLSNQAAKGLKHVSDHRLVHKDIAARNCLIASNLSIKISLPCMTKEPYQQEYTKHRNQVIPLRWMPYEAVYEDEYSTKSDVYSFSCLVWEMFHQGELPFNKLNDESVLAQLKTQSLVWKAHKAAPPALQELQAQCWSKDPRERPTFDEVVAKIGEIVVDSCL